jgi:hypothetical protein
MSGAIPRRAVGPPRGETEPLEFGREHISNGANASEVVRSAVDVYQTLEKCHSSGRTGVNAGDDLPLGGC